MLVLFGLLTLQVAVGDALIAVECAAAGREILRWWLDGLLFWCGRLVGLYGDAVGDIVGDVGDEEITFVEAAEDFDG